MADKAINFIYDSSTDSEHIGVGTNARTDFILTLNTDTGNQEGEQVILLTVDNTY